MTDARIYIATHKPYDFPQQSGYFPIFAGKALHKQEAGNMVGDDTGENISLLNKSFCELTVLYWIWKNCQANIVGLVHYRRYFADFKQSGMNIIHAGKPILDLQKLPELIQHENQIILPRPQGVGKERFFFQLLKKRQTVYHHYKLDHYNKDWIELEKAVLKYYPEYSQALEKIKNSTHISFFNMFITHKSFVNAYCTWLFKILFDVENRLDISNYDSYQQRIFGFMAERLLNVYVCHHAANLDIQYLDISFISE